MVIYSKNVKVFSKKRVDHLMNLQQFFKMCHEYKISLNPKNRIFVVTEGKILGYFICKDNIIIDQERCSIQMEPRNKRDI